MPVPLKKKKKASGQLNDLEQALLEGEMCFLNSRAHLESIFKLFSHQPAHLINLVS